MSRGHGRTRATIYKDVMSGFLFLTNPKYLHPCRPMSRGHGQHTGRISVARGQESVATAGSDYLLNRFILKLSEQKKKWWVVRDSNARPSH